MYFYFQLPLMILIIAPAIDGLKKEWREASENMGASQLQYWRYVAFPVLLPSLLGSMILLFGNAFGAQATAYQLTGGFINLVTILIGNQLGNKDPGQELADTVQPNIAAQGGAALLADRFPVAKEMTRARVGNFRSRRRIVHHTQSSHPIRPAGPTGAIYVSFQHR